MYIKTIVSNVDAPVSNIKIGAYYYTFDEEETFLSNDYQNENKFCFIAEEIGMVNGTKYFENELLINIENYVRLIIDDNGDLNLTDYDAQNRYEINDMGELIVKIYE